MYDPKYIVVLSDGAVIDTIGGDVEGVKRMAVKDIDENHYYINDDGEEEPGHLLTVHDADAVVKSEDVERVVEIDAVL